MHSPGASVAGRARLALQQVYDLYMDRHQLPVWSSILILGGQPIATDRRAGVVRAIAGTAHYAVLGPWVMRGVRSSSVHLWLRSATQLGRGLSVIHSVGSNTMYAMKKPPNYASFFTAIQIAT